MQRNNPASGLGSTIDGSATAKLNQAVELSGRRGSPHFVHRGRQEPRRQAAIAFRISSALRRRKLSERGRKAALRMANANDQNAHPHGHKTVKAPSAPAARKPRCKQ